MNQTNTSSFAHITLATRDVSSSAKFFQQTLGWTPIDRPQNIDCVSAWLAVAPDQELHLVQDPAFEISPFEREFGRHVAINYPATGFSELKKKLVEHGAELIAPERDTPFERFFFRDQNGYVFEVIDSHRTPEA